jgi:hypothetical protein
MCEPENPQKDIFEDRESLLKIWENERTARELNSTLLLQSIRHFTTLVGTLIAAHGVLLTFLG